MSELQKPFVHESATYAAPLELERLVGDEKRLLIRSFSLGRLSVMLARGTDRDSDSDSAGAVLFDSEYAALGLQDRRLFTFVTEGGNSQQLYQISKAIAVYDARHLARVDHPGDWNGLYRFTTTPQEALLGVVHGSQDPDVFTEQMLQNHPNASSEFVSDWIKAQADRAREPRA